LRGWRGAGGLPQVRDGAKTCVELTKETAMTTLEIGTKLVELCKQGKNHEAMETLYAPDVVAVEAAAMPGMPAETQGLDKVRAKSKWWADNHTIHSASVEGPWPNGDRFAVRFSYDITNKPQNRRMQMDEIALFTVKNGKIVREEFFYVTG
jgi:ketosteroid isomerase-like protein